jgi:hypothetical protein
LLSAGRGPDGIDLREEGCDRGLWSGGKACGRELGGILGRGERR